MSVREGLCAIVFAVEFEQIECAQFGFVIVSDLRRLTRLLLKGAVR
jgi:hypothetical protein